MGKKKSRENLKKEKNRKENNKKIEALVTTPWEWSFSKCKPRGCHNQLSSKTVCAFHVSLGAKPVGQSSELRTEKGMANGNNLGEIRWMVRILYNWQLRWAVSWSLPCCHLLQYSSSYPLVKHYSPTFISRPSILYSMTFRIFPSYTKLRGCQNKRFPNR